MAQPTTRPRTTNRPARRRLTAALCVSAALVLGAGLLSGGAVSGSEPERKPRAATVDCSQDRRALERLGDNFARACLPGQDLSGKRRAFTALEEDETVSSRNMGLIANIPKQGPFTTEGAFNSDLAFQGKYAYAGNYNGFMVYDISKPGRPKIVSQVLCPGSQNDISVSGDLLVLSVDSSRTDDSCASTSNPEPTNKADWEGVRVFDISSPATPRYVAAVETQCGSHTHSLAPSKNGRQVFVYVSSYRPADNYPDCQPPHDKISIVKIPRRAPEQARVVATPVLFPGGGYPGDADGSATSGCHDITAYPSKDIAAGACMGNGILMDISDRARPRVTERVKDTANFAFWHSATFNNAGTKVVFTDELGGGGAPTCNPETGPRRGANGIYDIVRGQLKFRSYYKIKRTQSDTENCVAHNGSLIPVKGKDIMVQAWYQGGISVFDFTDSRNPKEIAWFDRGPVNDEELTLAGSWSAYYYNGYVYSNEIARGFDVLDIRDRRTRPAKKVRMDVFNPQSQPSFNG